VFGASGQACTFDFQAGDVGYVPFAVGHYIENAGATPLRFLETFRSSYYADLWLDTWMALTPPELVHARLTLDRKRWKRCARTRRRPCRPHLRQTSASLDLLTRGRRQSAARKREYEHGGL